MKMIDAHLHFRPEVENFTKLAKAVGHENHAAHLMEQYERWDIAAGVVMGNRGLSLMEHRHYPPQLRYCIGLDSHYLQTNRVEDALELVEKHLQLPQCVGVKLYPGYYPAYVTDPVYDPIYSLAQQYQKPVAIHTGATANSGSLLRYSHPLTLDELAVKHPYVQFVMCHFGNPWLTDAAAVLQKNENVAADLSGLLAGRVEMDSFFAEHAGYVDALRTWLGYLHAYDRIMFGTDWPLVNLGEYIDFIARLVPQRYHQKVFFDTANQIYRLGL